MSPSASPPAPFAQTAGLRPFERQLAQLMVESLQLDCPADAIAPEAPLFGAGLGLDSIDALELALAISKTYGVELKSDDAQNRQIFASLRALALHVEAERQARIDDPGATGRPDGPGQGNAELGDAELGDAGLGDAERGD